MKRQPPGSPPRPRGLILAGSLLLGLGACGDEEPTPPQVCASLKQPEVRGFLQCGPTLDFTPINSYQGPLADAVQSTEEAVALIDGRCTGTLIHAAAGPVVLTAGHCARPGDRPLLAFNFEDTPDGEELLVEGTVIEQADAPDYALIQLDALPAATPARLTTQVTDTLAIIQHPRGYRKVLAEGTFLASCDQLVYYADLDTLVGSSGAGVLNRQGHLLGIHTDGDCDTKGRGVNWGWTSEAIVEASPYLQSADIADR